MKISEHPAFNSEWDKKDTEKKTKKMLKEIGELQHKMYAQGKYSINSIHHARKLSYKFIFTLALYGDRFNYHAGITAQLRGKSFGLPQPPCIAESRTPSAPCNQYTLMFFNE